MIEELLDSLRQAHALTEREDAEFHGIALDISAWSVAQHLDHLARAQRGCVAAAEHILEGHGEFGGEPTERGREVLDGGRIPRGVADTPERARPADRPERSEIQSLLQSSQRSVASLAACPGHLERATGRMAHHDLGAFGAVEWLRFATIHNRHHLAIIGEILGAEAP